MVKTIKNNCELIKNKNQKIKLLQNKGIELYSNEVKNIITSKDLINKFCKMENDELRKIKDSFSLAGRIMALRNFGKIIFATIQDSKGKIQIYISKHKIGSDNYSTFKLLEIGDIIFIDGNIFKTKTNELTIETNSFKLLTKSIQNLPEKWHGLKNTEIRYRQRYLDLLVNSQVKHVFKIRSHIIQLIRKFMLDKDFLEVETPILQTMPGGAIAKPFKTFHNALNMDFYLRISPELYLKRLIIGGMEKIFELNKSFRNEGLSTFHNPEFTMIEFYQAYANYNDFMNLTEELLQYLCMKITNSLEINYQNIKLNFTIPFKRITVVDALKKFANIDNNIIFNYKKLLQFAQNSNLSIILNKNISWGKLLMNIFNEKVEQKLIQPTFITQYPLEVSPLARKNNINPLFTDRFELYIAGKEIANAFSELNDPFDQKERFLMQLKEKTIGNEEKFYHYLDEDFLSALEYGMPPCAGEGIGIDRLVMLLTNSSSIRDVILFPQMRNINK